MSDLLVMLPSLSAGFPSALPDYVEQTLFPPDQFGQRRPFCLNEC
jgi:hypothetical protein